MPDISLEGAMGVAELRPADTFHDLMQRADAALYRA
jgi:PleD family two-component response regulator